MSDPNTFGPVLARMRAETGLSQSRLALLGDFDHSFVSRLEAGNRNPTRETVDRLAEAMGLGQDERAELFSAAGFLSIDTDPLVIRLAGALAGDDDELNRGRQWLRTTVEVALDAVEDGVLSR